MYFSDRLCYDQELRSDDKVEPNRNPVMSNVLSMLPDGSGLRGHRGELNKPKIGIALQTTATGEEYRRGFHTILNSIGWSPLKFWKQEVSIDETVDSNQLALFAIFNQELNQD